MEKLIIGEEIIIDYFDIGLLSRPFLYSVCSTHLFIWARLQGAQYWARAWAWDLNNHWSFHCKGWGRFRVFSHYRIWRSWWARGKNCCWVSIITRRNSSTHRSGKASCGDFCRYLSRSYYGLLSSSPAMRVLLSLRLPDTYDSLQIFLQQLGSQEIKLLMGQSTISSVFSEDDLPRHAACILLELSSTVANLSWKSVQPSPP